MLLAVIENPRPPICAFVPKPPAPVMNWIKERIGITEPIYGPSGIQPVTKQCDTVPFTESTKDDLQWHTLDTTCVETQCFYATADSGHAVMAQVIYNSVAGIRTTCQFSCKVYYPQLDQDPAPPAPPLWTSDTLENWSVDNGRTSFRANNCAVELSEDGTTYTIKSSTSKQAIVEMTFQKLAPGFMVGKDGTSYFGTDPEKPWGRLKHVFWPRCRVKGSILTQAGQIDVNGLGMFIHALQGIRPNYAAASWNFVNFQSPSYSAVAMEFTTPPSYGSTVVTVGGIVADGTIICAGALDKVEHTASHDDTEVGWPEPESILVKWQGSHEGVDVSAELSGELGTRLERVDVLAQIPAFLKFIIAQAAGSKPYIYQFGPRLPIKIKLGNEAKEELGTIFMEATFING